MDGLVAGRHHAYAVFTHLITGFTLIEFEQMDLSYYVRAGYTGLVRRHYWLWPYVMFSWQIGA